jgi:hypothetical protein
LDLTSPRLYDAAAEAAGYPDIFVEALVQGQLDISNLAEMYGWSPAEKLELCRLFMRLRPSPEMRGQWVGQLSEIKDRDAVDLSKYLAEEFSMFLSLKEEGAARDKLFSLRFPKLSDALQKRAELLKAVKLPEGVSFSMDPTLEEPSAAIRIDFTSTVHLRDQLTKLLAILGSSQELNIIFRGEGDWNRL